MTRRPRIVWSPRNIALAYALFGSLWILTSDSALDLLAADVQSRRTAQTVKGWVFVLGSAGLIYWLVGASQRELEATNERLDAAIRQSSILHRILRHNLRNTCTVIDGNSQLLSEYVEGGPESVDPGECIEAIREQTDQLNRISEKTKRLRDLVVDERGDESTGLETVVDEEVATARNRFPAATFDVDGSGADVLVDRRLGLALEELLENAVVHNDAEEPTVEVSLERSTDDVSIGIRDDGPGLPALERDVLETDVESPMYHSEGLGLWVARTAAMEAGGDLEVHEAEPTGTLVEIVVPA